MEELLAQANALLQQATTKPSTGAAMKSLEEAEPEVQQIEYVCDESGCVVVFPGAVPAEESGPGISISGEQWKIDSKRWAARPGPGNQRAHCAGTRRLMDAHASGAVQGAPGSSARMSGPCMQPCCAARRSAQRVATPSRLLCRGPLRRS